MNKAIRQIGLLAVAVSVSLMSGCSKKAAQLLPEVSDDPVTEKVKFVDLPETAPTNGIAIGSGAGLQFEVNVEASDSALIQPGQKALVFVVPTRKPIEGQVTRLARGVSGETGQAIAWIRPLHPTDVAPGEFVYANITTKVRRHSLAIPRGAVFIREGREWAIREDTGEGGKKKFSPIEIKTGVSANELIEIVSGLKDGDQIVSQGGIGYLFPDFKASSGD